MVSYFFVCECLANLSKSFEMFLDCDRLLQLCSSHCPTPIQDSEKDPKRKKKRRKEPSNSVQFVGFFYY